MKLKQREIVTQTNIGEGVALQIMQSAKMFEILSNKIYTYKIAAVVRELISNAIDANREAGNPNPVKVVLPNSLHPYFEVIDEGVGMSPDFVVTTFAMYGGTTKEESNEAIGAYGLGAKTPYAYTNSFTVTSVKDGVETVYDAYMNNGAPFIVPVADKKTDKPNGVAIKIPVAEHDFYQFFHEATFLCSFFDIRPHVVGGVEAFEFDFDEEFVAEIKERGYAIAPKNKRVSSDLYEMGDKRNFAIMGGVPYPFYREVVPSIFHSQQNGSVFINFDIGELDVPASREAISDDYDTKNVVDAKVESIRVEYRKTVQDKLDACDTILEAHMVISEMFERDTHINIRHYQNTINEHFHYKGQPFNFTRELFSALNATMYQAVKAGRYSSRIIYKAKSPIRLVDVLTGIKHGQFTVVYSSTRRKRELTSLGKANPYSLVLHDTNVSDHLKKRVQQVLGDVEINWIDINDHVEVTKAKAKRSGSGVKLEDAIVRSRVINSQRFKEYDGTAHSPSVFFESVRRVNTSKQKTFYLDASDIYSGNIYLCRDYRNAKDVVVDVDGVKKAVTISSELFELFAKMVGYDFAIVVKNATTKRKIEKLGLRDVRDVVAEFIEDNRELLTSMELLSEFGAFEFDAVTDATYFNFHNKFYEYKMVSESNDNSLFPHYKKVVDFFEENGFYRNIEDVVGHQVETTKKINEEMTKLKVDDVAYNTVMYGVNIYSRKDRLKKFEFIHEYAKLKEEHAALTELFESV